MRQIIYFLITSALLVDLAQIGGFFGGADLRLWQVIIILIFGTIIITGQIEIQKRYLIVFGLLLIHSVIVSFIFGSVVYSALIQLSLLFAVMITLRSSATFVTTKDYIRLYLFAALVVAISIILESVIAFTLPGLADATIYQVLRKDLGPLGMVRAHGLMMEPSEVALILPPAIYVALLQRRNRLAAVLVLASLLSYSALTFVGLIATLVCFIWTIRGFRPLHVAAVLVVMAGASYMVEPIRDRVQWVILAPQYLAGTHLNAWELQDELTGTVGSLVVALRVMAIDLRDSWFLGTGFGNFGYGADSVLSGFSDEAFREMSKTTVLFLKASTGGGLAVRIIGELGIFGIIALTALVVMLARMMRLTRKLCRQRPSLRYDSRVQAIGLMVVVIVPFFIRKDAYLDIYLLLPLTFGFLAASGFRNGARGAVKTGPVSAQVPIRT